MPAAGSPLDSSRRAHTRRSTNSYPLLLQVQLLVARLAEVKTDLLVSISRAVAKPIAIAGKPIATEEETAADAALALSILDSIEIRDKGLFG